jgi:CDGSH-type Zn-finger protein
MEIEPRLNGPLKVSGTFTLNDAVGQEFDLSGNTAVFLCRCGQSAIKPLCDGSHKVAGFQASGIEPPRKH